VPPPISSAYHATTACTVPAATTGTAAAAAPRSGTGAAESDQSMRSASAGRVRRTAAWSRRKQLQRVRESAALRDPRRAALSARRAGGRTPPHPPLPLPY
jgi:hypothetical protein